MDDQEFLFLVIFNFVGVGIAVWFLYTRLRAKLVEVEDRKARRWKRDSKMESEE
ncbi:MAG: hypothetical protein ACPHDQ_05395 [Candidatus Thalassarchaeaceae archaeon]|jgi:hypothetical protein|tara:strand:+ start:530 stop:691 length:162 start_codon:yes stop_codon:yes gene_type:complete